MPTEAMVPVSLAVKQIEAYHYAFVEAVHAANTAIRQRDFFMNSALESRCELMRATDTCPEDVDDPCPAFFGGYCNACRRATEMKARYL